MNYRSLFTHSLVDKDLGYFQLLLLQIQTYEHLVQVLLWKYIFIYLG